jgi:ankyrin repeat protein
MGESTSAEDHKLLAAAIKGDVALVESVLSRARRTATHGPDGRTALHAAAEAGHLEVVEVLLEKGWDKEARTTQGSTPLHLAAKAGHVDVIKVLLDSGMSPEAADNDGAAPLHVAAAAGHTAVMGLLVKSGANVNMADHQGAAPIHLAAGMGQAAAVSMLVGAGAAADSLVLGSDLTPLHIAAMGGDLAVLRVLLGLGASVNARASGGFTPLRLACQRGHMEVVRELLLSGAAPNMGDSAGIAALHAAVLGNRIDVVRLLLQVLEVVANIDAVTHGGWTPLKVACTVGYSQVASLLLAYGADMRAAVVGGSTLLRDAVCAERLAVVRVLLAAGADPGQVGPDGATTLHDAVILRNQPILQELLAAMAARGNTGIVDARWKGATALHWAVESGHISCMEALLAAGADADKLYGAQLGDEFEANLVGATVLHLAVQWCHAAAVPLLATPGNLRQVWAGHTPLMLAVSAGKAHIAHLLVAAGSPAGVPSLGRVAPMVLAARSSNAALRVLLPAMVRNECEAYQQQQRRSQQQQQQQQEEGHSQHSAPAALLATTISSVSNLLAATAAAGSAWFPEQSIGVSCFSTVAELLGPAAASGLLYWVLRSGRGLGALYRGYNTQLLKVLHSGWLAALEPVLQVRQRWANRLQRLVTWSPQQQGGGGGGGGVAGEGQPGLQQQQQQQEPDAALTFVAQAKAAAAAGDWRMFVRVLEQLTGSQPSRASTVLYAVAEEKVLQRSAAFAGLCYALLRAWLIAKQQAPRRAQQEAADVVVSAVQAWQGSRLHPRSRPLHVGAQAIAGRQGSAGAGSCRGCSC